MTESTDCSIICQQPCMTGCQRCHYESSPHLCHDIAINFTEEWLHLPYNRSLSDILFRLITCKQSWGSYFMKVIYYILLLYQYNILQLHISNSYLE